MASGNKSTQIATVTPKTAAAHPQQTTSQQYKQPTMEGPQEVLAATGCSGAHVAQQHIENSVSYVSILGELA